MYIFEAEFRYSSSKNSVSGGPFLCYAIALWRCQGKLENTRETVPIAVTFGSDFCSATGRPRIKSRIARTYDATSSLPAHLNYFPILYQDGNAAPATIQGQHPSLGLRINFYVILAEFAPGPFEPIAKLTRIRAMRGPIEFKRRHDSIPPGRQE